MLSDKRKIRLIIKLLILSAIFTPLSVFASAYFVLSPVSLAPYMIYPGFPCKDYSSIKFARMGLHEQPVEIPVPGAKPIKGFYFAKKGAPYVLLLSHGQSPLVWHLHMIKPALTHNYNILIYDYRGFGASEGTTTTSSMMEDGIAAYDYLVKVKHFDARHIVATGGSLGTGVTANLALKRDCAAVVLISPYTTITRAAHDALSLTRLYPSWLYPKPELACMPLIKGNSHTPVLLIHGTADTRIKVQNSRDLMAASQGNCQYVELPGMPHSLAPDLIMDQINTLTEQLDAREAHRHHLVNHKV